MHASVLIVFLFACAFQLSLSRGWCFRGICTIGGGTFGGFIPLGREGKRALPFSFALSPLNLHGTGGQGGAGFVGSILPAAALLVNACQRVGRASVLNVCFLLFLRRSIFPHRGAVFWGDIYNRRRRFCWIHVVGTGGEVS